eukprot:sb/3470282/
MNPHIALVPDQSRKRRSIQQQQPAAMRRSLDAAQRLTAPSLDWESPASPGRGWELNEFSSLKGTASGLGFSKLQNSVTASGRTTSVEDARSVNRHSQTRSGEALTRRSGLRLPVLTGSRPLLLVGAGSSTNSPHLIKGTASGLGFSKLQNSVTASGRTTSVEDARSVNRHSQTRSGGAGERRSPASPTTTTTTTRRGALILRYIIDNI